MKINIEKSQIWTPCRPPLPPISLLLVIITEILTQYVKSKKKHLLFMKFFHFGLSFLYIYTNIYIYIYI